MPPPGACGSATLTATRPRNNHVRFLPRSNHEEFPPDASGRDPVAGLHGRTHLAAGRASIPRHDSSRIAGSVQGIFERVDEDRNAVRNLSAALLRKVEQEISGSLLPPRPQRK